MITLFSVPRPFEGHTGIIQANALRSWARLEPRPDILILGGEDGAEDIAAEIGAVYLPVLGRDVWGTPLVSEVFRVGVAAAKTEMVCYVNADIVLLDDFMPAVESVAWLQRFLLIGQRTDLAVTEPLAFQAGWQGDLARKAQGQGTLHRETGIDYFVFRRKGFFPVAPFSLGRWRWDNWIVWAALKHGLAVVDGTACVTAIHQNHDYGHHTPDAAKQLEGNNALVAATGARLCTVADASYVLTPSGKLIGKDKPHGS